MLKIGLFSTLFFIFFIITGVYIYYLYKYPGGKPKNIDHRLKHYSKNIILQTGNALVTPNERHQHFLNFSIQKKRDVIRIGTFGDSFTYGSEVDKTETYPYQLQELFNKSFPNKKIEVLNFGKEGAGFQEQYFLWKKYGKIMNLDYFLLGPNLSGDRDITFRKEQWMSGFPKNRYILTKNKNLKQVNIKGRTWEERYKNYYKLIPTWTALRYDKRPFKALEILFPFLKGKIKNLFYYTKIPSAEEVFYINSLLLKEIAKLYNQKILWLSARFSHSVLSPLYTNTSFTPQPYSEIIHLFEQYQAYNINYIESPDKKLYYVFGHGSSLYNEYIAKIYFQALLGEHKPVLEKISCYFTKNEKNFSKNSEEALPAGSIQITDGKTPLTSLRHNSKDHHWKNGSYSNYKYKNTKSFISFFSKSQFLESPFFPVSIKLKDNMKIYIQSNKKGEGKILLGKIKALDSHKIFFVFCQDYIRSYYDSSFYHYNPYNTTYFIRNKMFPHASKNHKKYDLLIEDHKIGRLKLKNSKTEGEIFTFFPKYKKSFLMMGAFSGHVRVADFAEDFPLYIHYNKTNGEEIKSLIPDWRCKKEKKEIYLNLPNFKPLNL